MVTDSTAESPSRDVDDDVGAELSVLTATRPASAPKMSNFDCRALALNLAFGV
eukprot:CAMPEP_0194517554 /NCGR_PEP_ID=MMETSP0253-20130528/50762_1 /TAXON_ID=2966 /ORGANISM="Noctiluca scintillans" /LENGTH=52 /DNA_ID=CAMNT_0039361535 /DNA_START=222 /DNA_END=380 /DNA_ORIENTATION=+